MPKETSISFKFVQLDVSVATLVEPNHFGTMISSVSKSALQLL